MSNAAAKHSTALIGDGSQATKSVGMAKSGNATQRHGSEAHSGGWAWRGNVKSSEVK